ncbi:MAG: hypothetical protein Q8K70_04250 [Bacteroidota bacterium]|nr:hypothetical protein [Bacteroidota bacterium]
MFKHLTVVFLFSCFINVHAQMQAPELDKNAIRNTGLIGLSYGRHIPGGDLGKRFGGSNTVGIYGAYKFNKNWVISANIATHFSSSVKESGILDSITGTYGELLDVNGNFSEVRLYQRGYLWHVDFGKIIPINKLNLNSGIMVTVGAGMMEHKIRMYFQRNVLPQLEGDYAKGYDRLSNGLLLRTFIGYQRIDPEQSLNFFAGVDYIHGFTKNRRAVNFDTRVSETKRRNDLLLGFKIGIMISIQGKAAGVKKGQEDKFFE